MWLLESYLCKAYKRWSEVEEFFSLYYYTIWLTVLYNHAKIRFGFLYSFFILHAWNHKMNQKYTFETLIFWNSLSKFLMEFCQSKISHGKRFWPRNLDGAIALDNNDIIVTLLCLKKTSWTSFHTLSFFSRIIVNVRFYCQKF